MKQEAFYDVVVAGGGSAGVAAALGAAYTGKRTVLLEQNHFLGGNATNAGVSNLCGFYAGTTTRRIVGGAGDLVLGKLKELGEDVSLGDNVFRHPIIPFDTEALKYALDLLMKEAGVELLLSARVIDTQVEDGMIRSLTYADGDGSHQISGGAFVDATGDAFLAMQAGNSVMFGGPDPVQMATLVLWVDGVEPGVTVTDEDIAAAIEQAARDGLGPMTRRSAHIWSSRHGSRLVLMLPNFRLDNLSAGRVTEAETNVRAQAYTYLQAFRRYIKGMEKAYLVTTGPQIGVRETRRVRCEKMLSHEEVISGRPVKDSIAIGGWPMEVHRHLDEVSDYVHEFDERGYQIPLRCLKADRPGNLWCCGRNICADQLSLGSARVMGTCFATGHAAGVAAALTGRNVRYDVEKIQKELLRQGAYL